MLNLEKTHLFFHRQWVVFLLISYQFPVNTLMPQREQREGKLLNSNLTETLMARAALSKQSTLPTCHSVVFQTLLYWGIFFKNLQRTICLPSACVEFNQQQINWLLTDKKNTMRNTSLWAACSSSNAISSIPNPFGFPFFILLKMWYQSQITNLHWEDSTVETWCNNTAAASKVVLLFKLCKRFY